MFPRKIKVSDIISQLENGDAVFEYAWPWRTKGNPAHVLLFRDAASYAQDSVTGWFWMRVWITVDGKHGYLRDTVCSFDLVKDVPMQMLWDHLQEIYTMGKIAGDVKLAGPIDLDEFYRRRFARHLNLVYNVNLTSIGYYERHDNPLLATYERRLE